jgi:hypothetical protein
MTHRVYALGDSVMEGAGPGLYNTLPQVVPDIDVDAIPNRQFRHAPELVTARTAQPPLPETIVVHLGTNGLLSNTDFEHLVASAPTATRFVIINVHAPRDWTDSVNQRLADGVRRHPHEPNSWIGLGWRYSIPTT